VGDKVELIGQIIEVKQDYARKGKGKNKPYVFINFGPWKKDGVKISIWSEGLSKLTKKPSKSWVGQWVSVTGLIDPPYSNPKYGYTHFSVTVLEEGQIQALDEKQARFRLDSIKKTGKRTDTTVADTKAKGKGNGAKGATTTTTTNVKQQSGHPEKIQKAAANHSSFTKKSSPNWRRSPYAFTAYDHAGTSIICRSCQKNTCMDLVKCSRVAGVRPCKQRESAKHS